MRSIFNDKIPLGHDTPILVVCAVGGRSYAAGQLMVRNGFTHIYNMRGGLDEWKQAGLLVIYPSRRQK